MWCALSDEKTGLSYTIVAGPCQRSRSQVRVPRDNNLLSQIRDLEGQVPRIYIPQEQGGPGTPPGTGYPFSRLLRLAGLRWRYSNPPPHGVGHN
jgi:hypothetical protein